MMEVKKRMSTKHKTIKMPMLKIQVPYQGIMTERIVKILYFMTIIHQKLHSTQLTTIRTRHRLSKLTPRENT